jgi:outer membrane protein OmpA-like peptidoglycan-associated protein
MKSGFPFVWMPLLLLAAFALTACKKQQQPVPEPGPTASSATSSSPAVSSPASNQSGSLEQRLRDLTAGTSSQPSRPQLPDWKPASAGLTAPDIPLRKDLLVITAIHQDDGDYESFKHITAITPTQVTLEYSAARPAPAPPGQAPPPPDQRKMINVVSTRIIDVPDLANAHIYAEMFGGMRPNPEHLPGSTAISASAEIIRQLRANQPVDFHYDNSSSDMLSALSQAVMNLGLNSTKTTTTSPSTILNMADCTLHRVEQTDLAVPVLLNEQPVELPAIHASCTASDQQADLYYLDLPSNPITLAFQLGSINSRLQVIKIAYPPTPQPQPQPGASGGSGGGGGGGNGSGGGGGAQMEQALADKKPVEIYGIYFDFNKDVIKPESRPVLDEIAAVMRKNPDWKLSVSGHTDSIGDANFNLGLSQRRAAAVKNDLVTHYQINPDRLTTAGYGASRPVADNNTLEGRARNRRVELQRE